MLNNMLCQFTSDTSLRAQTTSYNKSATELSLSVKFLTPHHYEIELLTEEPLVRYPFWLLFGASAWLKVSYRIALGIFLRILITTTDPSHV